MDYGTKFQFVRLSYSVFISRAQPSGARLIKSLWCMWVCGQVPPRLTRISPNIFSADLACTW